MNTRESVQFVRQHKGLAIGLGLAFYSLFLLPYIGWILAPVVGIVAGTLVFIKIKKPEDLKSSGFE
jgi:CysZ protein